MMKPMNPLRCLPSSGSERSRRPRTWCGNSIVGGSRCVAYALISIPATITRSQRRNTSLARRSAEDGSAGAEQSERAGHHEGLLCRPRAAVPDRQGRERVGAEELPGSWLELIEGRMPVPCVVGDGAWKQCGCALDRL